MADAAVMIARYRDDVAVARLVGEDGGLSDSYRAAKRACENQIREARELLADLMRIRNHRCSWNGNDYCNVCGADGRG